MAVHVRAHRHAVTQVYLHTFGCKVNQYDTEVLRQTLEAADAQVVDDPKLASAAVINSCTVTHVSEAKMRGLVRRIVRENHDCSSVIVIGCAATLDDGKIQSIPGVTSVIGGTDPKTVLSALGLPEGQADPILHSFERGARAWVKIQDGCDEHCTYCATRVARGKSVSRSQAEILSEVGELAERHPEIVLTGVHIGSYGHDLDAGSSLSALVQLLVKEIPEVRFRLSSVEATQIDDGLLDLFSDASDRLAPHIHAPLQSGSDRLLKLMGRHWYTSGEYRRRLERLATRVPTMGLGADVIVGFPGETDEDFDATRSLVEALPFTYLHVFPHSPRAIAPSAKMRPVVAPNKMKQRSSELRAIADTKGAVYCASRNGQAADVVLLRRVGEHFEGLTEDYLSVAVSAEKPLPNRFNAILRIRDDTLWAEPQVN